MGVDYSISESERKIQPLHISRRNYYGLIDSIEVLSSLIVNVPTKCKRFISSFIELDTVRTQLGKILNC